MQSRRNDGYRTLSPSTKMRSQHKYEMGRDPYPVSRGEAPERRPHARRSISPHTIDGSRRVLVGNRKSDSVEGREHGWHLGEDRTEKVLPGSPSSGQQRKRPHFDNDILRRKYEHVEPATFDDVNSSRTKNVYGYDDSTARMTREKDYSEDQIAAIDGRGIMGRRRLPVEEGVMRGSYRLPPDMVTMSQYGENAAQLPPSSQGVDMGRFGYEKRHYRESAPVDKIAVMQSYKEGEKHRYHRRDVSYSMASAPHPMDVSGTSQFKDYSGTSSGISSSGYLASYRDGASLPSSDEYPRNDGKLTEPTGINVYGERPLVNIVRERDLENRPRNIMYYQQGAYSPNRIEPDDTYSKQKVLANDECEYPPVQSNELNRMMPLHTRLGYDHTLIDHDQIDSLRPKIADPVVGRIDNTESSSGNQRKSTLWDHSTLQKQTASEYIDMRGASYAAKQRDEHLVSEYSYGKRISRDCELPPLDVSSDHQIPHLRPYCVLQRDASPEFWKGRLQNHRTSIHDADMHRYALGPQKSKDGHGTCEPSDNLLKRKYCMEEDIDNHSSRIVVSSKWNLPPEFEDLYESGEEWIDEDMSGLNLSRTRAFNHKENRKAGRTYDDGRHHSRDFTSDGWLTSQDSFAHAQGHAVRFYKNSGRYIKHTLRPAAYNWHKSPHINRRSGMHKHHKGWQRNDDYDNNAYVNDDEQSEDWVNMAEPEPSEDTEEFKQMVHDAFLKYSKRINANLSVQRRYKEQGKSGSLFCIACGRSNSKEFMDTQRLVTHAFMSHKVGLRVKHLGLHKAICVLLGWNTVVPLDTITWSPEVLPDAEASAQKQDLILWPPLVVIHNISMSNNNPMVQKVIPIEGIQAFLRDKGFVGGKIKVCLGKPADQSTIVVKFLGTFTGLGMAERLHDYFSENKRGRLEFEQYKSDGKSIENQEAGTHGDNVERLLYGYMGVAEDLDRLDFNSKKFSLIKSKKEILDLANAPVKPDER